MAWAHTNEDYLKQNELNEAQKNLSEQSEENHSADPCNFEAWWSHLKSGSSYDVWMPSQQKDLVKLVHQKYYLINLSKTIGESSWSLDCDVSDNRLYREKSPNARAHFLSFLKDLNEGRLFSTENYRIMLRSTGCSNRHPSINSLFRIKLSKPKLITACFSSEGEDFNPLLLVQSFNHASTEYSLM